MKFNNISIRFNHQHIKMAPTSSPERSKGPPVGAKEHLVDPCEIPGEPWDADPRKGQLPSAPGMD